MGPSGCGKSTLLHLLGDMDRPTRGEILLAGHRLDALGERALARVRRAHVGFVFQSFHLMDELSAGGEREVPALLTGYRRRRARRRAVELLEQSVNRHIRSASSPDAARSTAIDARRRPLAMVRASTWWSSATRTLMTPMTSGGRLHRHKEPLSYGT